MGVLRKLTEKGRDKRFWNSNESSLTVVHFFSFEIFLAAMSVISIAVSIAIVNGNDENSGTTMLPMTFTILVDVVYVK
jgi:hypothetical protein